MMSKATDKWGKKVESGSLSAGSPPEMAEQMTDGERTSWAGSRRDLEHLKVENLDETFFDALEQAVANSNYSENI